MAEMGRLSERLERLAASQPGDADVERLRELAASLRIYAGAGGESLGIFRRDEVTSKAVITFKPEPEFTEQARQQGVTGAVRLRAVLGADGQVRHVIALKRLPAGLTEKCAAAARRIRFTPATVNGAPVSQWVVLEYNFNIY
jgi:protein TonB